MKTPSLSTNLGWWLLPIIWAPSDCANLHPFILFSLHHPPFVEWLIRLMHECVHCLVCHVTVVITSMSFPVCVSVNTVHCTVVIVCQSHESVRAVEPYAHSTPFSQFTIQLLSSCLTHPCNHATPYTQVTFLAFLSCLSVSLLPEGQNVAILLIMREDV